MRKFFFEDIEVNVDIEQSDTSDDTPEVDLKERENEITNLVVLLRKHDVVLERMEHMIQHIKLFSIKTSTLHLVNQNNEFGDAISLNLPTVRMSSSKEIEIDGGDVGGLDKEKNVELIDIDSGVVLEGIGDSIKNTLGKVQHTFKKLATSLVDMINELLVTVKKTKTRFDELEKGVIHNIGQLPKDSFSGKKAYVLSVKDFTTVLNAFHDAVTRSKLTDLDSLAKMKRFSDAFKSKDKGEIELNKIFNKMTKVLSMYGYDVKITLKEKNSLEKDGYYKPEIDVSKGNKGFKKDHMDLYEVGWTPATIRTLAPKIKSLLDLLLDQKNKITEFNNTIDCMVKEVDKNPTDPTIVNGWATCKSVVREAVHLYVKTCRQAILLCSMFCNVVSKVEK